jgi:hypothetical protein
LWHLPQFAVHSIAECKPPMAYVTVNSRNEHRKSVCVDNNDTGMKRECV